MMPQAEQFPFVATDPSLGAASLHPFMPVMLTFQQQSVGVMALLDTGAAVNVLPFDAGQQLGADWHKHTTSVQLTANLANEEARAVLLVATVGQFTPVRLAFAWTKNNSVPVILGQVNFFMEFDVCFFRARSIFEVKPK